MFFFSHPNAHLFERGLLSDRGMCKTDKQICQVHVDDHDKVDKIGEGKSFLIKSFVACKIRVSLAGWGIPVLQVGFFLQFLLD